MQIQENISLAPHTTFYIGGPAKYFCQCETTAELTEALEYAKKNKLKVFVLGGGSNILISDTGFDGLVIQPRIMGLDVVSEDETSVTLKLAAGEDWDKAVAWTVEKGWWGIENLSHIPGSCGGLAVQNVGAYGQEASQVVQQVEIVGVLDGQIKKISSNECQFGYRKSIFNTSEKNKYIITAAIIKLSKKASPNLSYGDVKKYMAEGGIMAPTQAQIRQTITIIRDTKFPYPKSAINGSAGSFFRGPIISQEQLKYIESIVTADFGPEAASRLETITDRLRVSQGYKTPTAFLLDLAGLKGLKVGGAQVNPPQPAIVLNATGTATAADVMHLAELVINTIHERFGVELEIEPELVGF